MCPLAAQKKEEVMKERDVLGPGICCPQRKSLRKIVVLMEIPLDSCGRLIAVVDDEPDILRLVSLGLERAGFKTKEFLTGREFLDSLKEEAPDLVILDLMLPDLDGFEVCRFLKSDPRYRSIPVIMLTARADEEDRVVGLELGADDYVVKPFSPRELVARVKAVLRRGRQPEEGIWVGGILYLDFRRYEALVKGRRVKLTPTEFRILAILASRKGWVFTRGQLLDQLWGNEKAVSERAIDVHIKRLREKLGEAAPFIKSVRGVGYKLEEG